MHNEVNQVIKIINLLNQDIYYIYICIVRLSINMIEDVLA